MAFSPKAGKHLLILRPSTTVTLVNATLAARRKSNCRRSESHPLTEDRADLHVVTQSGSLKAAMYAFNSQQFMQMFPESVF